MAQEVLSEEFAREVALAGSQARQKALDSGLAVPWFDEAKSEFYIDHNGHRFMAEFVDGQFRPMREIKIVDAA